MAPKPLPPRWIRRLSSPRPMSGWRCTLLLTLPVWLLVARPRRRSCPGRCGRCACSGSSVVCLVWERGLLALFGLWLASGFGGMIRTPPFQRAHYVLTGGFLRVFPGGDAGPAA